MFKVFSKFYKTYLPGIDAQIWITCVNSGPDKGMYYVNGYLVDHSTKEPIISRQPLKSNRTASLSAAKNEIKFIVGRLAKSYSGEKNAHIPHTTASFMSAFNSIDDSRCLINEDDWDYNTSHRYLTYFVKNILPRMDTYGMNITIDDMNTIWNDLAAKAAESKKSLHNIEYARQNLASRINAANFILNKLYLFSDQQLPHVFFPKAPKRKKISHEQIKAFSPEVRITLAYLLRKLPQEIGGLALGLALMFYSGLRPAEAVKPTFGEIKIYYDGAFGSYFVDAQVLKGKLKKVKTKSGNRIIVLPRPCIALIEERINFLVSQGYTLENIKKMPIVSKANESTQAASSNDLSAFGKKLLKVCGVSEAIMVSAETMKSYPLLDTNGKPIKDPCTYMMRRDWCSRSFNCCGLVDYATDYVIGHKNPDSSSFSYGMNVDGIAEIAAMFERFVAIPELSSHPLFTPCHLTKPQAKRIKIPLQGACSLVNHADHPLAVNFVIESNELQDTITIESTCTHEVAPHPVSPITACDKASRPIFTLPYHNELYERCKKNAERIIAKKLYE